MKNNGIGIFGRVFCYTLLLLTFFVVVIVIFFFGQFKSSYEMGQRQQLSDVFLPLMQELPGKSDDEIREISEAFHQKNTSFEFCIRTLTGEVLYNTPSFTDEVQPIQSNFITGTLPPNRYLFRENIIYKESDTLKLSETENKVLYTVNLSSNSEIYKDFFNKTIIVLIILIAISVLTAAAFAKTIANPVKKLAADTKKMANMETVGTPSARKDEIGQLSKDVYKMYEALKSTISELEIEIAREREMEENQRYFFSAASHELKTPIASVSAMLEGMLENVIDYNDYPMYLRKCLNMMSIQSKLISEILEIVRLTDNKILPRNEDVQLYSAVNAVVSNLQALAESKSQTINISVPESVYCKVDTNMFSRILSNIIMNATQNSPENGIINIWSGEKINGYISLCILNSGAYIDEETLSKLFEPFYRADKARNKSQGRNGLGLTIVKKALDCMGIPFSLENSKNGVIFRMSIPVAHKNIG